MLTARSPGNVVGDRLDVLAKHRVPEQIRGAVVAIPLVGAVVAIRLAVAIQLLCDAQSGVVAHKVADPAGYRIRFIIVHQVGFNRQ